MRGPQQQSGAGQQRGDVRLQIVATGPWKSSVARHANDHSGHSGVDERNVSQRSIAGIKSPESVIQDILRNDIEWEQMVRIRRWAREATQAKSNILYNLKTNQIQLHQAWISRVLASHTLASTGRAGHDSLVAVIDRRARKQVRGIDILAAQLGILLLATPYLTFTVAIGPRDCCQRYGATSSGRGSPWMTLSSKFIDHSYFTRGEFLELYHLDTSSYPGPLAKPGCCVEHQCGGLRSASDFERQFRPASYQSHLRPDVDIENVLSVLTFWHRDDTPILAGCSLDSIATWRPLHCCAGRAVVPCLCEMFADVLRKCIFKLQRVLIRHGVATEDDSVHYSGSCGLGSCCLDTQPLHEATQAQNLSTVSSSSFRSEIAWASWWGHIYCKAGETAREYELECLKGKGGTNNIYETHPQTQQHTLQLQSLGHTIGPHRQHAPWDGVLVVCGPFRKRACACAMKAVRDAAHGRRMTGAGAGAAGAGEEEETGCADAAPRDKSSVTTTARCCRDHTPPVPGFYARV
ncbi:hypothetical protein JB92DRAFT_3099044 [Gautieria morchelliformis]|nr:hypothetical protein JB92DRAFT_3099044 [Gautieria morchelliformis]